MKEKKLDDVLHEEIQDLYDAEKQIVRALPKMAKAAASDELRDAFENHLEETKEQVRRLEKVFQVLGHTARGKKCEGMQGLLEEGEDIISEFPESPARDAALIAAAQKVEHYEMAAYGSARTFAKILGQDEAAELLEETLEEEKAADEKLTEIAESVINVEAASSQQEEQPSASTKRRSGGRHAAAG
jgi:ferritin-like metal-binding protein YciE